MRKPCLPNKFKFAIQFINFLFSNIEMKTKQSPFLTDYKSRVLLVLGITKPYIV